MLLRIAAPLLAVAGTEAGESSPVSGDAPPPLGVDAPPDKGPLTSPNKGSASNTAPGEGAVGVSKSLLVRWWIWPTNSCTCGVADTPLAFSWLSGILAVTSRTPI